MSARRTFLITSFAAAMLLAATLACDPPLEETAAPADAGAQEGAQAGAPGAAAGPTSDIRGYASTVDLDPCTILSTVDAKAVLSTAAIDTPTSTSSENSEFTCTYESLDGTERVSIVITRAASMEDNNAAFAAAKDSAGGDVEEVEGVGDEAFYDTVLDELNIKRGEYWVILSGEAGDDIDLQEALTLVAPTIVVRLP